MPEPLSRNDGPNPFADIRAQAEKIASQTEYSTPVIIMTPKVKEAYERFMRIDSALRELLEHTSRKRRIRRYQIRRLIGHKQAQILFPRAYRRIKRIRFRYVEWKHRHDPDRY